MKGTTNWFLDRNAVAIVLENVVLTKMYAEKSMKDMNLPLLPMSLKRNITAKMTLFILAVVTGLFLIFSWFDYRKLSTEKQQALHAFAVHANERLTLLLSGPLWSLDVRECQRILLAIMQERVRDRG